VRSEWLADRNQQAAAIEAASAETGELTMYPKDDRENKCFSMLQSARLLFSFFSAT
jgi:hypothetical protein